MANESEMESMEVDSNEKHESHHKVSPPTSEPQTTNTKKTMDADKKKALQLKLRKLASKNRGIVVSGCDNWRCTNPYCKSNVINSTKEYSDCEASKLALKMIKTKHKSCSSFSQLDINGLSVESSESSVEFAFKHWRVLSFSFLNKSSSCVSSSDICIDFKELNKTFSWIVSCESLCVSLRSILSSAITDYTRSIQSTAADSTTKLSLFFLRSIMILLQFPLIFSEDIECHSLLSSFLRLISVISASDFSRIVQIRAWFHNCFSFSWVCRGILYSLQQYMTLKITFCEDEIEDLTEEWRSEYSYDSVVDSGERDEIEQFVAQKQQLKREEYIRDDIECVILMIDILYTSYSSSNEDEECKDDDECKDNIDLSLFNNDGLNCTICSRSGSRSSMHRRDFLHYRERDFFTFLSYPYLLNAASKSRYLEFENLLSQHRARRRRMFDLMLRGGIGAMSGIGRNELISELDLVLRIRRDSLISDTLGILQVCSSAHLRRRLRIIFDGEEGIDQGGLTKEYFQLMMNELFSPKYGMFISHGEVGDQYWFNRDCFDLNGSSGAAKDDVLVNYELVGKLVGIAIYNNTILDLRFPKILFKKLLSPSDFSTFTLSDFCNYDAVLGRAFSQLLSGEAEFGADVYCRNFVVSHRNQFGECKEYELCRNGHAKLLNESNKSQYVALYIKYILCDSICEQFAAFKSGFQTVCDSALFGKFSPPELELLICGSRHFDFDALELTTSYSDGLNKNSRLIRDFWNIAHQLTQVDKRKLLTFCTGSDRVPINGLGEVSLTISKNGDDNAKLPTSHTCFNHLLLPEYDNAKILKSRLLTAIQNSQGFGLL